jgi:hypothetical protein
MSYHDKIYFTKTFLEAGTLVDRRRARLEISKEFNLNGKEGDR